MLAPELLEGRADGVDIDDLAVADDADREVDGGCARQLDDPVERDLRCSDAARFDLESDDGADARCFSCRESHAVIEGFIGGKRGSLYGSGD